MKKNYLHILSMVFVLSFVFCTTSFAELKTSTDNTAEAVEETSTAELHFKMEEMWIDTDYGKVYGEMYLPEEEKEKYPTVILVHGFNGDMRRDTGFAKAYADAGFAVYGFEFVNGGRRSRSGEADGTLLNMSVLTEYDQLVTIIDTITALDYVDTDNLFIQGGSMGGFVSAYTTAQMPEKFKAVLLMAPAFNMRDMTEEEYKSVDEVPDTFNVLGVEVSKKFYEDIDPIDIYELLPAYNGDVLITHGTEDITVPYEFSEKAMEYYENATLIPIEGGTHGYPKHEHLDRATEYAIEFLLNEVSK